MKKAVQDFIVTENTALNASNFCIKLQSSSALPAISPGQFINVEIKDSAEIFLRRPFSIFEVDKQTNSISLLVKILGRGSKKLTEISVGESLSVVFPLGNGFTMPDKSDKVLLIGGGSGVAPVLFLAKMCALPPENVTILIGARTKEDHISIEDYEQYGEILYATEDGSLGEKGFVTHHPVFTEQLAGFDKIYTCGPDQMMKSIGKAAKEKDIYCEVSLENLMACGFGVCLCCIEPTRNKGNACVCTEGPVFNIKDLKW